MKMRSRAEWGARTPRAISLRSLEEDTSGHWNGPKVPDVDHSRCDSLVRGIQNFHMDTRGWNDIAYNFMICQHGVVYVGRGLNTINGANGTNEGNRTSHAVMWLSGQGNVFTEAQKKAFRECVQYISDRTKAPDKAIGHRDHKYTECPGDERYAWIHAGMPTSGHILKPEPKTGDDDMPGPKEMTASYPCPEKDGTIIVTAEGGVFNEDGCQHFFGSLLELPADKRRMDPDEFVKGLRFEFKDGKLVDYKLVTNKLDVYDLRG